MEVERRAGYSSGAEACLSARSSGHPNQLDSSRCRLERSGDDCGSSSIDVLLNSEEAAASGYDDCSDDLPEGMETIGRRAGGSAGPSGLARY